MNKFRGIKAFDWGEIVYNPQARFGPRWQPHHQLVLVHRGGAEVLIDGERVRVRAGEALLLFPGHREEFRFAGDRPTRHSWIHAREAGEKDGWGSLREGKVRLLPIGKRMETLVRELLATGKETTGLGGEMQAAIAEAAFFDFFSRAGYGGAEDARAPLHPAVERTLRYLDSHYNEECDLNRLARNAGLSAQHLSRLFRGATGRTPIHQLWRIREEEGRRLLRETGLSVQEVAEKCGFRNAFHFSRRMRARYGRPPRELRRGDWEGRTP